MVERILFFFMNICVTLSVAVEENQTKRKMKPIDKQVSQGVRTICFYGMAFAAVFYLYNWWQQRKFNSEQNNNKASIEEMKDGRRRGFASQVEEVSLEDA